MSKSFGPAIQAAHFDYLKEALKSKRLIGEYSESAVREFYRTVLSEGDVAIDGGAAVGRHSIGMAVVVGKKGRIYSFEPLAEAYQEKFLAGVHRSLAPRNLDDVIILTPKALADHAGYTTFTWMKRNFGLSGINTPSTSNDAETEVLCVELTTLDHEIPREDQKQIKFIKLDLEGGEFDALKGARDILSASRPFIALECGRARTAIRYGYSKEEFFNFFDCFGYSLFNSFGGPFGPDQWDSRGILGHEFFAVPSDRNVDLADCGERLVQLAGELL